MQQSEQELVNRFNPKKNKDGVLVFRAFHFLNLSKELTLSDLNIVLKVNGFSGIKSVYEFIPAEIIPILNIKHYINHFCEVNEVDPCMFTVSRVGSQYMAKLDMTISEGQTKSVPFWSLFTKTSSKLLPNRDVFYFSFVDDTTGDIYLSDVFLSNMDFKEAYSEGKTNLPDKEVKTYIMLDYNTGLYKIGKSNNPVYREKTLQSEKPTIEMLFIINSNIESKLHKKYSDKRVRGEWFSLSESEVEEIAQEAFKVN